jgi:hypothetical protein
VVQLPGLLERRMHELLDARLDQIARGMAGSPAHEPVLETAVDRLLADLQEWRWLTAVAQRAVRAYPEPAAIRDCDTERLQAYLPEFTGLCREALQQTRPDVRDDHSQAAVILCGQHVQLTLGHDPRLPGVAIPVMVGETMPAPSAN